MDTLLYGVKRLRIIGQACLDTHKKFGLYWHLKKFSYNVYHMTFTELSDDLRS